MVSPRKFFKNKRNKGDLEAGTPAAQAIVDINKILAEHKTEFTTSDALQLRDHMPRGYVEAAKERFRLNKLSHTKIRV